MNHDDPTHQSPPRAKPLQQDRPLQGTETEPDQREPRVKGQQADIRPSAEKLKEQTDAALENVREGYGGGRSR
ncbi:MAG: hypothetical protein EOP35_09615 [Rubrivivax sp.]|nr:MAG: hypothetical protein EOP35_09615 [Rubrivivax sp.]